MQVSESGMVGDNDHLSTWEVGAGESGGLGYIVTLRPAWSYETLSF